jgi:hypothetical protein
LELAADWSTRRAHIAATTVSGVVERLIETGGDGHWRVDGARAPQLDGCRDVDLESSALTNALPVHRLGLAMGEQSAAPAAYVRAATAEVARLEQHYSRVEDHEAGQQYDYEAPAFDFRCRLVYDRAGLVVDYPGIATRAG